MSRRPVPAHMWDVEAQRPWLTAALAVAAVGLTVLISAVADGLLAHLLP